MTTSGSLHTYLYASVLWNAFSFGYSPNSLKISSARVVFGPQCAYSDHWIKHSKQLNFSLIRRGRTLTAPLSAQLNYYYGTRDDTTTQQHAQRQDRTTVSTRDTPQNLGIWHFGQEIKKIVCDSVKSDSIVIWKNTFPSSEIPFHENPEIAETWD